MRRRAPSTGSSRWPKRRAICAISGAGPLRRSDEAAKAEVLIIAHRRRENPVPRWAGLHSTSTKLKRSPGSRSSSRRSRSRATRSPSADHERAERSGRAHRHHARPMSMSPATPGGPSWRRCIAGSGRKSWSRCMARSATCGAGAFGLSQGIPHAVVQRNGDLIRLAPDGPEKIGEERVEAPLSTATSSCPPTGRRSTNGARFPSTLITVACPSMARGRWPARQWFVPSACRSSKIATISWPTRPMPPSVLMEGGSRHRQGS